MGNLSTYLTVTFDGRMPRYVYAIIFLSVHIAKSEVIKFHSHSANPKILNFAIGLIIIYLSFYLYSALFRRLHDFNYSGWWAVGYAILALLPLACLLAKAPVGYYYISMCIYHVADLYLLLKKGTVGVNKYGIDPLEYPSYVDYLRALKPSNSQQ